MGIQVGRARAIWKISGQYSSVTSWFHVTSCVRWLLDGVLSDRAEDIGEPDQVVAHGPIRVGEQVFKVLP